MNADISDIKSLFGQHLIRFCKENKLMLSSQILMPEDSYTYISEAWSTTSWLDHCICTADAHDCLEKLEILYDLVISDHIPVLMTLNVENLPELRNYENYEPSGKLDWVKLTANELWQYKLATEKSLSSIGVSTDTIRCNDVNCKNPKHIHDLYLMYDEIVKCLNNASRPYYKKVAKNDYLRAGWNDYVSELHSEAREAFQNWVLTGKARFGPEYERKKQKHAKFKYAVRFYKKKKRGDHEIKFNGQETSA